MLTFIIFNHVISHNQYMYMHICAQLLSHVCLFVTPQTVACQASLSVGFPSQAYWSGLPFPPWGDLSGPGIEPISPASPESQADSSSLSYWVSLYIYNPCDLVSPLRPCLVKTTHRTPGKHVSCFYIFSFSRMSSILTVCDYLYLMPFT